MLFFAPYEIETLQQENPWTNVGIILGCTVVSLMAIFGGGLEAGDYDALILDGFSIPGFVGHVLLHLGLFHLVGNMVFLWVFGNAICANIGNWIYLGVFLLCTVFAATTHVLLDGALAIGASGAINGIVGMVFVMYPLNRIYLVYLFLIRGGTTSCPAWVVILGWFAFDIWGASSGAGGVAYWAHIGGFLGGAVIGLTALQLGWVQLTEYDNRSLLAILRREEE